MSEQVILAVIGLVGLVLAEVIRRDWNKKAKEAASEAERLKAEREREDVRRATEDARWERLDSDVKRLDAKVSALQLENEALRRENAEFRADNVEAQDQIRDQEELIEDLITYLIVREDWEASGTEPPPPTLPWRVRSALRRRRAAMTGHTPLATDPRPNPIAPKEGTP